MHFSPAKIDRQFVAKLEGLLARLNAYLIHGSTKLISVLDSECGQLWMNDTEFTERLKTSRIAFQFWYGVGEDIDCYLTPTNNGVLVDLGISKSINNRLREVISARVLFEQDITWSVCYNAGWEFDAEDWEAVFSEGKPMPITPYWLVRREPLKSPLGLRLRVSDPSVFFAFAPVDRVRFSTASPPSNDQ